MRLQHAGARAYYMQAGDMLPSNGRSQNKGLKSPESKPMHAEQSREAYLVVEITVEA